MERERDRDHERGRRTARRPEVDALETRQLLSASDPSGGGSGGGPPFGGGIGYSFTNWPAAPLADIRLSAENTLPIIGPRGQGVRAADWIIRDPFPVTDLDGRLAKIDGWYVMAGLATPRTDAVGTLREFGYILSRDGVNWQEGGALISTSTPGIIPADYPDAADPLRNQLFSGDMRYDAANDRLLIYYTPVMGANGPGDLVQSVSGGHMRQEIAVATATPVATPDGLTFTNFATPGVELRPDGRWYVRPEDANTETEVYAFRDPYHFRDPETGANFLMFAANWGTDQTIGYPAGAITGDAAFPDAGPHDVVAGRPRNDGVVGLAVATDDTLTNYALLPPIFGGVGVNEQLELPHVVHQDGNYYLFVSTHNRTFVGDLKYDYPEGLYGFVADTLAGPYRPVNGTGLVLANPPEDELQNYGWKVVATAPGHAEVFSFINKGNSGTIAPGVALRIDGDRVTIAAYQNVTGLPQGDPRLPLAFGVTATAAPGAAPVAFTGGLDAASDTGARPDDNVTRDNTPTYAGTAPAGTAVRLQVRPQGQAGWVHLGGTIAGADGTWSLTTPRLPDGRHTLRIVGADARGATLPGGAVLPLTIDTVGPRVTTSAFQPGQSRYALTLQDGLSGLDAARAGRASSYALSRTYFGQTRALTPSRVVAGTLANPNAALRVELELDDRHRLAAGHYGLRLADGGITDLAGNAADPSYARRWTYSAGRVSRPQEVAPGSLAVTPPNRPALARAARRR
jgi:levansucrase